MAITVGDAHNLYAALQRMDNDASLKLKDEVALAVVINLNRLEPHVRAYEKQRQKMFVDLRENGFRDEALFNAKFSLRDVELREVELKLDLQQIALEDLKPTKGEHFIPNKLSLRPMITDWPE